MLEGTGNVNIVNVCYLSCQTNVAHVIEEPTTPSRAPSPDFPLRLWARLGLGSPPAYPVLQGTTLLLGSVPRPPSPRAQGPPASCVLSQPPARAARRGRVPRCPQWPVCSGTCPGPVLVFVRAGPALGARFIFTKRLKVEEMCGGGSRELGAWRSQGSLLLPAHPLAYLSLRSCDAGPAGSLSLWSQDPVQSDGGHC